jgi:hypothetical protein
MELRTEGNLGPYKRHEDQRENRNALRFATAVGRSLTPLLLGLSVCDAELAITRLGALVRAFTKTRARKLEIVNFTANCAA